LAALNGALAALSEVEEEEHTEAEEEDDEFEEASAVTPQEEREARAAGKRATKKAQGRMAARMARTDERMMSIDLDEIPLAVKERMAASAEGGVPSKASKATALLAGGAKALLHLPVGTAKATVGLGVGTAKALAEPATRQVALAEARARAVAATEALAQRLVQVRDEQARHFQSEAVGVQVRQAAAQAAIDSAKVKAANASSEGEGGAEGAEAPAAAPSPAEESVPPVKGSLTRNEANKRFLAMRQREGNGSCAECHAADTSWIVLDYGVLICVHCAGAHRGLGTHISKVRSTNHDHFTAPELDWIGSQGNAKSNRLYEGAIPNVIRRPAVVDCPDVVRRLWLRYKYDELLFTAGQSQELGGLMDHETMCGWMVSIKEENASGMSRVFGGKRRRYAAIREGSVLCWYADESDAVHKGAFPLAGSCLSIDPENPQLLKLHPKGARDAAQAHAVGAHRPSDAHGGGVGGITLQVPSYDEAEAWVWALYQSAHGAECRLKTRPELLDELGVAPPKSRTAAASTSTATIGGRLAGLKSRMLGGRPATAPPRLAGAPAAAHDFDAHVTQHCTSDDSGKTPGGHRSSVDSPPGHGAASKADARHGHGPDATHTRIAPLVSKYV